MKRVVVLTHSRDEYVPDRVIAAVEARGASAIRVDSDLFPGALRVSLTRDPDEAWLTVAGDRVSLHAIDAVWCRRLWPPTLPDGLDEESAAVCRHEGLAALEGALRTATRARFVNPPDADRAAQHKLWQLQVARSVGLTVPPTLVTNDPDDVRAFCARHPAAITKLLTVDHVGTTKLYTRRLAPQHLDDLDGLQLAPLLVQAEIPKRIELRVAVVGRRCFTGGIRAAVGDGTVGGGAGRGPVDWRHPSAPDVDWEPWELDATVAERVVALTRALGLVYGGVDLVVSPDGAVTFLEINPAGEWGMLERSLGLPIAEALADALVA